MAPPGSVIRRLLQEKQLRDFAAANLRAGRRKIPRSRTGTAGTRVGPGPPGERVFHVPPEGAASPDWEDLLEVMSGEGRRGQGWDDLIQMSERAKPERYSPDTLRALKEAGFDIPFGAGVEYRSPLEINREELRALRDPIRSMGREWGNPFSGRSIEGVLPSIGDTADELFGAPQFLPKGETLAETLNKAGASARAGANLVGAGIGAVVKTPFKAAGAVLRGARKIDQLPGLEGLFYGRAGKPTAKDVVEKVVEEAAETVPPKVVVPAPARPVDPLMAKLAEAAEKPKRKRKAGRRRTPLSSQSLEDILRGD